MKCTYLRNTASRILMFFLFAVSFIACQKEIDGSIIAPVVIDTTVISQTPPPDLTTKVVAKSISGFVTNETDAVVAGASVKVGATMTTTDKYGYFEVRNAEVVKNAAMITVTNPGYFKGIKTYLAETGKSAFFRIKLIPKTVTGNFAAATGGIVTTASGLKITFPANALINAATGNIYSGTVNVASRWIDPTAGDLNNVMPGDLRGLDTANNLKKLTTYGMAAVDLSGSGGELLQIVAGKKASLAMSIPSSIASTAPSSIPLWYFDEDNGLWKQQGSASKTGNQYVGDVSHFSFWNCDIPANYVTFNCSVKDASGSPLSFIRAKVSVVGDPQNAAFGYTDSSGYVIGAVPVNSNLKLELFAGGECSAVLYAQTFTTSVAPIALGNITVSIPATGSATLTGTVTNCNNSPVSNGYVIVHIYNTSYRYLLAADGKYNFSHVLCLGSETADIVAEDNDHAQQNATATYTIHSGSNSIPNIKACGVSTEQFIKYSARGLSNELTYPLDTLYVFNSSGQISIGGQARVNPSENAMNFTFDNVNMAANTTHTMTNLLSTFTLPASYTIPQPMMVTITEYGGPGQFISGNYSVLLNERDPSIPPPGGPPGPAFTLTCSFRLKLP